MGMKREKRKYPKENGNLASVPRQTRRGPKGLQMILLRPVSCIIINSAA